MNIPHFIGRELLGLIASVLIALLLLIKEDEEHATFLFITLTVFFFIFWTGLNLITT